MWINYPLCNLKTCRKQFDGNCTDKRAYEDCPYMNPWIPVTERLPEEDGEYLVTFESGYAEDYGFDPIGIAPFEVDCEGFGIWQERFHPVSLGSLGSEWVDIQVTAWRPLPEPYQEEES